MRRLVSRVDILKKDENKVFRFQCITEVTINSSYDTLTDTCVLEFPRGLKVRTRANDGSIEYSTGVPIKVGDYVEVFVEYDTLRNKKPRFRGYVRNIQPTRPVRIELEDEMYLFKRERLKFSYKEVNVEDILDQMRGIIPIQTVTGTIGKFRSDNLTAAQVLQKLKQKYGFTSFVRDGKLYFGKRFWEEYRKEHVFDSQFNIIEDRLEFRTEEEIDLTIRAVSIIPTADGKDQQISVEVGDGFEQFETRTYYNITDRERLRQLAESELLKRDFTGYRGTFTTFGDPWVRHGDVVTIRNLRYPEKEGKYLVRSVRTKFGQDGFRQEIELDVKLSGDVEKLL